MKDHFPLAELLEYISKTRKLLGTGVAMYAKFIAPDKKHAEEFLRQAHDNVAKLFKPTRKLHKPDFYRHADWQHNASLPPLIMMFILSLLTL